jgi:hypothetical protein
LRLSVKEPTIICGFSATETVAMEILKMEQGNG